MNGFPITAFLNQTSSFITGELIRLAREETERIGNHLWPRRVPKYDQMRPSLLHEEVKELLFSSFSDNFPTLMRAFHDEQEVRRNLQSSASTHKEVTT